eukprot:CAMPEP_0202698964 /NCGR_PEP_ID=MMETSP1385-20130828/12195_1 /ASSEMBLY_ACC=CAM_ASM_000861 /TAXON_ID=933848 /ORGANISM="Elphidium margaritaceum" /LENGTH=1079 /DNA_ID=CAMNT_0049355797 /DNA_START=9 /DNA_END=3248 /DNA_ORIENTATION=+
MTTTVTTHVQSLAAITETREVIDTDVNVTIQTNRQQTTDSENPETFRIASASISQTVTDEFANGDVLKRFNTVWLTRDDDNKNSDERKWFVDDYVTLDPLGEPGQFGIVYKCYKRKQEGIYFAVKQINKAKFYDEEKKGKLQDMKNEIEVMNTLGEHEFICKLHETYEDSNLLYLILDLLPGGELFDRIEKANELPEDEAQRIAKQILMAVEYMQQHKVAHLDLKPANIIFASKADDPNATIKIIDFGESRIVRHGEKLNEMIGTLYYMAPEIVHRVAYDPLVADMWSVGVIIFCMLFGYIPFWDEEEADVLDKIKQGFNPSVCDNYGAWFPKEIPISENARDLIAGLLTTDPLCRYTVKQCLAHPWIAGDAVVPQMRQSVYSRSGETRDRKSMMRRQSSLKRFFLIMEEPIEISSDEDEDDDDDEHKMPASPTRNAFGGQFGSSGSISVVPSGSAVDDESSTTTTSSSSSAGVAKKGWLKKEGKLFKSWKRRYFILQHNGMLSYYAAQPKNAVHDKAINTFNVAHFTHLIQSTKIKFCFILCTADRNWKFIASTAKHMNEWMKAIKSVAAVLRAQNGGRARGVPLPMPPPRNNSGGAGGGGGNVMNRSNSSATHEVRKKNPSHKKRSSRSYSEHTRKYKIHSNSPSAYEFEEDGNGVGNGNGMNGMHNGNNTTASKFGFLADWDESKISTRKKSVSVYDGAMALVQQSWQQSQTQPASDKHNGSNNSGSNKPAMHSTLFGAEHTSAMCQLVNGVKSRLSQLGHDTSVLDCIYKAFDVEEEEQSQQQQQQQQQHQNGDTAAVTAAAAATEQKTADIDDDADDDVVVDDTMENADLFSDDEVSARYLRQATNTMNRQHMSRFASMDADDDDAIGGFLANGTQRHRTSSIHFGRVNREEFDKKYICKTTTNVSYSSFIEVIEYMLTVLWEKAYTQSLYEIVVQRISYCHKAKLFSIGVEKKSKFVKMKRVQNCFVGAEGIDWLIEAKFVKDTEDRRERATDLGNALLTKKYIKPVIAEKGSKFKDDKNLFYLFNDDLIDKDCLLEEENVNNNVNHKTHTKSPSPAQPNKLTQSHTQFAFKD